MPKRSSRHFAASILSKTTEAEVRAIEVQHELPPLEELEIASGTVFGDRRADVPTGFPPNAGTPRSVLESLLLPALTRPPCAVAFSGGRDSSAMLAAATQVARKHDLDDPVPVTQTYARHPLTAESEWQELVIRHLGLKEWSRIEIEWELEAVGPLAGEALRRHGLYWPANAHAVTPMLRAAAPGSLVTGNGGDEVLSPWLYRNIALMRRGQRRPRSFRELKYLGLSFLPEPLRTAAWRTRHEPHLHWLSPIAQRELERLWSANIASLPGSWQASLEALLRSRYLDLATSILNALAADAGVQLVQPFLDPRFVAAVAAEAPRIGHESRTKAMELYFSDLLPRELLSRPTKATFSESLFGPTSREFVASWDGQGVDPVLVDPGELRRQWARPVPDLRSLNLLQAAWLAGQNGLSGAQDQPKIVRSELGTLERHEDNSSKPTRGGPSDLKE